MNPLDAASGAALTLANGNLEHTNPSTNWRWRRGTFAMTTGKWYWEQTVSDGATASTGYLAGVATSSFDFNVGTAGLYARQSSTQYNNGSSSTPFSTTTAGDVLGFAFDADAGKLWVSKNGTFDGNPVAGTGNSWSSVPTGVFPLFGAYNVSGNIMNFGQRPFAYTAPSGFKALCTANLPTPTIANGATAMDVKLYTGNGSTQTISGLNFSSDLVWIKRRDGSGQDHVLQDSVRGFTSTTKLASSTTSQENAGAGSATSPEWGYVTGTSSTGFDITASTSGDQVNKNTWSYAAWCWDAGTSTVTNTQGSITSQVRANASAGFSIVTYTGTGSQATIGHGLNAAPGLIIAKRRDSTSNWDVYHSALGKDNTIFLNSTSAVIADSNHWGTATPNSTVFGAIGAGAANNAANGSTQVAYCFAPVAGYSSFGSYTGNGSADGPFVYTGFRPRWVMIKSTSTTGWAILDAARNTYNLANNQLFPHASDAELTSPDYFTADFLSNGFKLRTTNSASNTSAQSYIYAAFAESPFAYARAR
jgi:hypothetical protein